MVVEIGRRALVSGLLLEPRGLDGVQVLGAGDYQDETVGSGTDREIRDVVLGRTAARFSGRLQGQHAKVVEGASFEFHSVSPDLHLDTPLEDECEGGGGDVGAIEGVVTGLQLLEGVPAHSHVLAEHLLQNTGTNHVALEGIDTCKNDTKASLIHIQPPT